MSTLTAIESAHRALCAIHPRAGELVLGGAMGTALPVPLEIGEDNELGGPKEKLELAVSILRSEFPTRPEKGDRPTFDGRGYKIGSVTERAATWRLTLLTRAA